ncbi:MAG: hypothetical protein JWP44_1786 [Mucilaginibacter sp.]|nr:hypothetical protein [Mucilaginibacter sp.]
MATFILEPYTTPSSRYHCPECNNRGKTFSRYINSETGQHLADHAGRCNRVDNCGYHYKPRDYFRDNPSLSTGAWQPGKGFYPFKQPKGYAKRHSAPKPLNPPDDGKASCFIHPTYVNRSLKRYEDNNLAQYFIKRFGLDKAYQMIARYRLGTASHWPGATVFWQLDSDNFARTGKIMLYDKATGKRVKEPYNHIAWAHTLIMKQSAADITPYRVGDQLLIAGFRLTQCLFGEHLLSESPDKNVAIVESEKTAMIASRYDDSRVWLACGGISNLNPQLCQVLQHRHVTLFPDLAAYPKWRIKARQLQAFVKGSVFTVSTLLEQLAPEPDKASGFDLGDYL